MTNAAWPYFWCFCNAAPPYLDPCNGLLDYLTGELVCVSIPDLNECPPAKPDCREHVIVKEDPVYVADYCCCE